MCTAGRNGVRDGAMRNRLLADGMRWEYAGLVAIHFHNMQSALDQALSERASSRSHRRLGF
jgi:hypothetical protein